MIISNLIFIKIFSENSKDQMSSRKNYLPNSQLKHSNSFLETPAPDWSKKLGDIKSRDKGMNDHNSRTSRDIVLSPIKLQSDQSQVPLTNMKNK